MSDVCPTNSTDCLLRAILDANSGYNWNPLNFAFTAALSILGFVVAAVTLIQGLLAAGPGRLKASRSAVGLVYSRKSHTRFDRTELRFRTLIRVPVLDLYKLLDVEQISSSSIRSGAIQDPWTQGASGMPEASSRSLAGWYRLLEDLKLQDFSFETLPCATDYLPTDVQAAPAYASVQSLVVMALLAGCDKIQLAEGFLRVTGPNLQLDFRSHATLGVVAAYQHYLSTSQPSTEGSLDGGTIREALGHVRYGRSPLFELHVSSTQQTGNVMDYETLAEAIDRQRTECNYPGCASRKETVPSWTSFLQDEKPNQVDIDMLATLIFADKPTTARMFPTAATNFRRLLNDLGNQKYKDTWFHQSTMAQDLALIPESEALIGIANLEQFRVLRTSELQRRDQSTWFTSHWHLPTKPEGSKLTNYSPSKSIDQMSCLRSMASEAFRQDSMDPKVLAGDSIVVSDQALTACFSWLTDSEFFMNMNSENRATTRGNLMLQLREIDSWLNRYGGADALCCALNMIKSRQDESENVADQDHESGTDGDEPTTPKRAPLMQSRMTDQVASNRPVWIKCNRKWLAPEIANHYNLPWEFDQKDPAFLIIKQWIPGDFQAKLFEHTRKLKEEQAQGFTPDSRDGQRYFVRRRGRGRKSGMNLFSVDRDGRSASSRRLSTETGLMRRAGSKNTRGISQEPLGDESEIHKVREKRQNLGRGRGAQAAELELHDDNGAGARPRAASTPSQEHGQENMGSGDSKDEGDGKVHDDMVTSDDGQSSHGREASNNPVISRIKAMETVLLYRAMLFACLLATGTDTSDLLWLENRNRVVQVL